MAYFRLIPSSPIHCQPQSLFFSKLPLEIRLSIYEYALGSNKLLSLTQLPSGEIRATMCLEEDVSIARINARRWLAQRLAADVASTSAICCSGSCWEMDIEHRPTKRPAVTLLTSCLYEEAVQFLYTQNTLHLANPHLLYHLSLSVPSQHLYLLRHLQISAFFLPASPNGRNLYQLHVWEDCCRALCSLKDLRTLKVDIGVYDVGVERGNLNDHDFTHILQPLASVCVSGEFVITMPCPTGDEEKEGLGMMPYSIKVVRREAFSWEKKWL